MIQQFVNHGPVNVHSLICHRDIDLSLHCLRSLELCSQDPVRIVLHDDGSLVESDWQKIEAALKHPVIIKRRSADEVMEERLCGYPSAAEFRRDSVWGLKLLDIVLLEERACFYCDGDVRFFRPFTGLFAEGTAHGRSVFLADTIWDAYSVRPWHLLDSRRLRLQSGINTGLTIIDRDMYDLEFVDWFLKQPDWRCIPAWTEPTCWAALASRTNGHVVAPTQIANLYPSARITGDTFGGHFLSAYRGQWNEALWHHLIELQEAIPVSMLKTQVCSAVRLGLNQTKRKLGNTMRLWLNQAHRSSS